MSIGAKVLIGAGSALFWLLGQMGNRRWVHTAERMWAKATVRVLRMGLDVQGLEQVDPTCQYVVVALHEGFADALALFHLPLPLRFVARDELFVWVALGRYLRATRQVQFTEPPTRSSLRQMYRQIEETFDSGDSLVVFPQGSILGVEVAFQPGAFRIAQDFDRPVLPVVITGSHRVWEHPFTSIVRLDQRISIRVLQAIPPGELDSATIRSLERRMKSLALDPTTAPARRFIPERDGWWDDYRYQIDPAFPTLAGRLARRRSIAEDSGPTRQKAM